MCSSDLGVHVTPRYIAKPGGWFDAGTEVELLINCEPGGWIMLGLRNGILDEELCSPEEFDVVYR